MFRKRYLIGMGLVLIASSQFEGCAQQPSITRVLGDNIWDKEGVRVMVTGREELIGTPGPGSPNWFELTGLAFCYKGGQVPFVWKAIEQEGGRLVIVIESTGRVPVQSKEFEGQLVDLGQDIAQAMKEMQGSERDSGK